MNLMSSRTRLKSVSDRESAADMGMRSGEPSARIRFAPRTGLEKCRRFATIYVAKAFLQPLFGGFPSEHAD